MEEEIEEGEDKNSVRRERGDEEWMVLVLQFSTHFLTNSKRLLKTMTRWTNRLPTFFSAACLAFFSFSLRASNSSHKIFMCTGFT